MRQLKKVLEMPVVGMRQLQMVLEMPVAMEEVADMAEPSFSSWKLFSWTGPLYH